MKIQMIRFNLPGMAGATVVAAALLVGSVQAADTQGQPTTQGSGAAKLTGMSPADFIREAAAGNSAEIAFSEVAQRKAENAEVKSFAEHMVRDHQDANRQLQPIAQAKGLTINQPLSAKHQAKLDELQKLSGSEFDKQYMEAMLKDHQTTIAKFQAASRGDDPAVAQYAQTTLPKLREHMQHAKRAAKAAGVDDATIALLTRENPDAVGGSIDDDSSVKGSDKSEKLDKTEKHKVE